jgi:hypothetical protein
VVESGPSFAAPVEEDPASLALVDPFASGSGFRSPSLGVLGAGGVTGFLVGQLVRTTAGPGLFVPGPTVEAKFQRFHFTKSAKLWMSRPMRNVSLVACGWALGLSFVM